MVESLTDQQHQAIGTNRGVVVVAIRKGSPAFAADVLPGDMILAVSGVPVFDQVSERNAIIKALGSDADILIIHNGTQIVKKISIPSGEWI